MPTTGGSARMPLSSVHPPPLAALIRLTTAALGVRVDLQVLDQAALEDSAQVTAATAQVVALCRRVLDTGRTVVIDQLPRVAERGLDGGNPIAFVGHPLIDADGASYGVLCATTDRPDAFGHHQIALLRDCATTITEQLSCRQALATAEADASQFQQMVSLSTDVIAQYRRDGGLTFISSAVSRTLGFDPDEVLAGRQTFTMHPEDGQAVKAAQQAAIADGTPGTADVRILHADRSWRLMRMSIKPIGDPDGVVRGWHFVGRDVTEDDAAARAAEQGRRDAESASNFMQTVLDAIDIGVVSCDAQGGYTLINRAAHEIVGTLASDPQGFSVGSPGLTDVERGDDSPLQRVLRDGPVDRHNIEPRAKDGSIRSLRLSGRRLFGTDGEMTGAVVVFADISAEQAVAKDLARTQAEFTGALDAMPRAITLARAVRDADGKPDHLVIEWVNVHVCERIGKTIDEIQGGRLADVFEEVAKSGLEQTYLDVIRTGERFHARIDEYESIHMSRAFDVTVTPWSEDGLLIDVADITEQAVAQRDLQRSERMLQASQRAAQIGSFDTDLDTGKHIWSDELFAILGLDPTAAPLSWRAFRNEVMHPADRDTWSDMQGRLDEPGRYTEEFRITRPNGEVRHVQSWVEVELPADGTGRRLVGCVQDQTTRREREIALARSRELERLVIGLSPIGIALLDEGGRFVTVNRAFCSMLGRSEEELLKLGYRDITHPIDLAAESASHEGLMHGDTSAEHHDRRYLHANGHPLWVSVHRTLLKSAEEDQPVRVLAQIIDISERQQQADELSRQARTDALTGLANRRSWEPRLLTALTDALKLNRELGVAILDLDKFKLFNDTYGHPVGDQLLEDTAAVWRAYLIRHAPRALLARLGGEEFGVLLPRTDADTTRALLDGMISIVPRDQTASAGFAMARDGDDPRALMTRADSALYLAKNAGRARVESNLD